MQKRAVRKVERLTERTVQTCEAMERVVAKKNTNVYPEALEEAENKGGKPEEIGYARLVGLPKRKHSQRLLGCCRKRYITYHNNK